MKIGIVTLVDVNNYGGVLQAVAIQDYLRMSGHDAVLLHVRYNPRGNRLIKFLERPAKGVVEFVKDRKFASFRGRHFRTGGLPSFELKAFLADSPAFDAYVCGSDQIWNPGNCADELKRRLFFLDFGRPEARRVAYAASWGTNALDEGVHREIARCLGRFNAVSVREKSGAEIVDALGGRASWVPDPALLHDSEYWGAIADEAERKASAETLFQCEYRWTPCVSFQDVRALLCGTYGWKTVIPFSNKPFRQLALTRCLSPAEWLDGVRRSSFVLSNSYHAVLFSIVFKRPFLAIPLIGKYAGMNERIYSVTERLGLQDRLVTAFDPAQILKQAETPIDWAAVHRRLNEWRGEASAFLAAALQGQ